MGAILESTPGLRFQFEKYVEGKFWRWYKVEVPAHAKRKWRLREGQQRFTVYDGSYREVIEFGCLVRPKGQGFAYVDPKTNIIITVPARESINLYNRAFDYPRIKLTAT